MRRGALLLVASLLTAPGWAAAQAGSASIPAEAVVVTVGMTMTTLRDLAFGTVTKGVATTVLPTAAGAGAWEVTGNANAFVSIAFTLPAQLTNIQALPGSTMPITFGATSASGAGRLTTLLVVTRSLPPAARPAGSVPRRTRRSTSGSVAR